MIRLDGEAILPVKKNILFDGRDVRRNGRKRKEYSTVPLWLGRLGPYNSVLVRYVICKGEMHQLQRNNFSVNSSSDSIPICN